MTTQASPSLPDLGFQPCGSSALVDVPSPTHPSWYLNGTLPRPVALPAPDPGERCSLTCQHYPRWVHSASCLSPWTPSPIPIWPWSSPALSGQPSVPASSLGSWPPLFQPPIHPRAQPWLPEHAGQSCFFHTTGKAPPCYSLNAYLQFCAPAPRDCKHVSGYPLWPFQPWHMLPIQPGTPIPSLLSSLCSYLSSRSLFRGSSSRDPCSQADASTASGFSWFPILPPSQPSLPPAPIQATTTQVPAAVPASLSFTPVTPLIPSGPTPRARLALLPSLSSCCAPLAEMPF